MGCKLGKTGEGDEPGLFAGLSSLPTAKTEKGNATIRENLKKEIAEVLKKMETVKDNLKVLEKERVGIVSVTDELRTKLVGTVAKQDLLKTEREDLMHEIWYIII